MQLSVILFIGLWSSSTFAKNVEITSKKVVRVTRDLLASASSHKSHGGDKYHDDHHGYNDKHHGHDKYGQDKHGYYGHGGHDKKKYGDHHYGG